MLVTFHHHVLVKKENELGIVCFRCGGGIGDYLFFLVSIQPLLYQYVGWRRVLAVDAYPSYDEHHPLEEVCLATGLIEEVWVNSKGAGADHIPSDIVRRMQDPNELAELWKNNVRGGDPPGTRTIPVKKLLQGVVEGTTPKRFLEPKSRVSMTQQYPFMTGSYATLHPQTSAKMFRAFLPLEIVRELASVLAYPVVVMHFPSDIGSYHESLKGIPNVYVVPVKGMCDSIAIQAHASCHIGLESSQLVVALLFDVPTLFLQYRSDENPWLLSFYKNGSCRRADRSNDLVPMAIQLSKDVLGSVKDRGEVKCC